MGTFQSDYLIVEIWDTQGKVEKKADSFIKKIKDKQFRSLFHKFQGLTNGVLVYFMSYDGSKEGWDTSEKANKLRNKFVDLINENTSGAYIYHLKPRGDIQDEDLVFRREKEEEED